MKLYLFIILFIFLGVSASAQTFEALNARITKIYAGPEVSAEVVFEIPIDVEIVGYTPDKAWAKVKIGYNFLGYHEFSGWANLKNAKFKTQNSKI